MLKKHIMDQGMDVLMQCNAAPRTDPDAQDKGSRGSEAESIIREPANWNTTATLHHALFRGKNKIIEQEIELAL
jgi:hypothetical protein